MDEKNGVVNSSDTRTAPIKNKSVITDEVIRRRLVVDGDGGGDDRRHQTFLKSFLSFCSSEEFDKAADEKAFNKLMHQIQQMEYAAKRTHAAILMNEDTKNVYSSLQTAILVESEKTKVVIQEAKKIIEEETKHRKNSLEYEALVKLIESKPERKATEERRKELEETLKKYKDLRKNLIECVGNRERQVESLSFAIESLKGDIESEDTKFWKNSSIGEISPVSSMVMDVDPFPLEKDDFQKPLTPEPLAVSIQPEQMDDSNEEVNIGIAPVPTGDKVQYEELDPVESPPEEGESED